MKLALSSSKFPGSYWEYRYFPPSSGRFRINTHRAVKSVKLTWRSDIHHKRLLESSGSVPDPTGWSSSPAGNCISACRAPVSPPACSWQPVGKRTRSTPALRGLPSALHFSNNLNIIWFCVCCPYSTSKQPQWSILIFFTLLITHYIPEKLFLTPLLAFNFSWTFLDRKGNTKMKHLTLWLW